MNTMLYKIILNKLLASGLSKRKFCEKYGIPRPWFIEFMNPDKPFRPLQIKTQGMLQRSLGIPYNITEEYNKQLQKEDV
jgi:hypothetical protein